MSEAAMSEHTEASGIQKAASTHFPKTKSSVVGLEEVVRKGAGGAEHKRKQLERGGVRELVSVSSIGELGLGPRAHGLLGPAGEAGVLNWNCGAPLWRCLRPRP